VQIVAVEIQMQKKNPCQCSFYKQAISLQRFDDVIQHLFTLYQEQNPDTDHKSFSDLTDDIIEVLLTVEATAIFNEKRLLPQLKSYRHKHFLIIKKCLSL